MKWVTVIFLLLLFATKSFGADTNTVSSTVVTNNTPPTASAPSVVVNNSDVCKTAASAAIQTQVLGIASGMTITDENCERIKLSRSLYAMGMKVAAVSTLCQDPRVFDAMWMSGTPCPYMGKIGDEAKVSWETNLDKIPSKSLMFKQLTAEKKQDEKDWNKLDDVKVDDVEVNSDDYDLSNDKKNSKKQKEKMVTGAFVLGAIALGFPAVF